MMDLQHDASLPNNSVTQEGLIGWIPAMRWARDKSPSCNVGPLGDI